MADANITARRLREVVSYNPETGEFTRLVRLAQRHQVGDRADFPINFGPMQGYRRLGLDSRRFLAHRLAWLYVHGEWPSMHIDHINGDKGDNRIANLRDASPRINAENKRNPRESNSSGYLGVYQPKNYQKWIARLQVRGKGMHIGVFETPEEAHSAYLNAKRKHHEGCSI